MHSLKGTHAVVTGGGSGIGAAVARALAGAGSNLTLVARQMGPLKAVAATSPGAVAIVADVTQQSEMVAMVAAARQAHGPIDILIANAGAAESAAIAKVDADHWRRMIDVNLTGSFLSAQAALSDIRRPSDDPTAIRRIVFIASTAGLKGYPYVAPYVAAKHGVVGLMRALAAELSRSIVTVNAVCPGFTETSLLDASISNLVAKTGRTRDAVVADLTRSNPQGRFIQPDEVADAVLWLCSYGARSVTGQTISVSGGEV